LSSIKPSKSSVVPRAIGVKVDAKELEDDGRIAMQDLKFSIIIINYNYSRFLGEAISSALSIDAAEKEIIVIDDGSTDNSAAVIESFGGKVIPVFKTNGGAISCVNEGFRYSSGDIVIFLDADDRISRDVAKLVLSVWEPAAAKVQYLANVIDGSGASLGRVQPNFTKTPSQADMWRSLITTGNYVSSSCSANAYARWYLAEILPLPESYTAHKNAPDDLLNPVAPLYGKVITLLVPLCDYRHHGANDGVLLEFEIDNVRRMVLRDRERLDFVRKKALQYGASVAPDALLSCPYHMITCTVIRKHSPALCPYSLSLGRLTVLGIYATAGYRCIGLSQKLALIVWLLCVSLAPRSIALWFIALRYVPSSRPRWAAVLLSRFRMKGEETANCT
jgi:glycosyltransferase involved in cell wall biosynthesis